MTKKERGNQLSKLIEMQPPNWLTKEIYLDYQNRREEYKQTFSMRLALQELFPSIPEDKFETFIFSEFVSICFLINILPKTS